MSEIHSSVFSVPLVCQVKSGWFCLLKGINRGKCSVTMKSNWRTREVTCGAKPDATKMSAVTFCVTVHGFEIGSDLN
jgi:hypothetical protein